MCQIDCILVDYDITSQIVTFLCNTNNSYINKSDELFDKIELIESDKNK